MKHPSQSSPNDLSGTSKPAEDEFVLSLIATGIVQLYEQVQRGQSLKYPYPVPLQRGLDRLVALRLKRGQRPPANVTELLAWCQHPIAEWGLQLPEDAFGAGDCLIADGLPTNVCENWAYDNPDVEAELTETHLMQKLFEVCQSNHDAEGYVAFRKLLICRPVLTAFEFQSYQIDAKYANLQDLFPAAYEPAPVSAIVRDHFHCCKTCGNLLLRTDENRLGCENERCQIVGNGIGKKIPRKEQPLWLKRGLRRFINAPGLAEVDLAEQLKKLGLEVELWPMYDRYDIRITFPNGMVWAVDVKDWANPYRLGRKVEAFSQQPYWDKAFFVFPDEREQQRDDYLRAFRNHCRVLSETTKAMFISTFLKHVKKALKGVV